MFIDETWTATNMPRTHGRCRKGERLRMGFPHGHRKTTTLVAGLRRTGMVAPPVIDGPINGEWFEAYVAQVLVPTLKPGDVVILDNLSSHKRPAAREMIEAVGATMMFLPPYSPDFNPIEKAFSKLKALLRKAAERTVTGGSHRQADQSGRTARGAELLQLVRIPSNMRGKRSMGAYGHSRLRERIFGGVTQSMIDEAGLPLLLAH